MTLKQLKDQAMQAWQHAKSLRDKYGQGTPMSDWADTDRDAFNAAMSDWTEKHNAFEAAKKDHEQLSVFDNASDVYETPAAPIIPAHQSLNTQDEIETNHKKLEERRQLRRAAHREAFNKYLFGGDTVLTQAEQRTFLKAGRTSFNADEIEILQHGTPEERHALVGTVDNLGGFLVPEDFMTELIKDLAGFAVVRPMAKVRSTSRNAATFMTVASGTDPYPSGVSGNFRSEGWVVGGSAPPTQDQPRFGRERIPVHIWAPDVIELTMELMEDSAVNLDAEIRQLLAETRALDEDSVFINGDGIGKPMGVLQEVSLGNITTVASGSAGAQTYPGLVNLYTSLASQYRGRSSWLMNSLTLGLLMQLEDGAGNPIFPTNEVPTQLFTRPIGLSEFMPDGDTTSNNSIIFGDWSFYGIADRRDMRIIRLTERFAPNIGLLAIARVGGQVLKTNPFRAQVVS